jgi:predicted transcriptional regulator
MRKKVEKINGLGDLERAVMDVLWDSAEESLTVREVAAKVPDRAYTTVSTILDRLHRKGLVIRKSDDRTHRFAAAEARETYMATLMIDIMGRSTDRAAVLQRFVDSISPSESRELREAMQRKAKQREKRQT